MGPAGEHPGKHATFVLFDFHRFIQGLEVQVTQNPHLLAGMALESFDADVGVKNPGRLAGRDVYLLAVEPAERNVPGLSCVDEQVTLQSAVGVDDEYASPLGSTPRAGPGGGVQ